MKRFNLNKTLVKNLNDCRIYKPTLIQELVIPEINNKKDIIAKAQTGTGKTLAFLIPIVNRALNNRSSHIQSIILSPTKELAQQTISELNKLVVNTKIKTLLLCGGKSITPQINKLNRSVDIVVATPGRLIDHLKRKTIKLTQLNTFILDEADQMLYIGFQREIKEILKHTNDDKQILCFSATIGSKVNKLSYKVMNNPIKLTDNEEKEVLQNINQKVISTTLRKKQSALFNELNEENPFMAIIFCRTQRRVDKLENAMAVNKYNCAKLHGGMKHQKRKKVINRFRSADLQYLIATDVAARGLDINGITHIYNYDIPESCKTYIHRIGRTARMNDKGDAVTFITPRDQEQLNAIEKHIKMKLPQK